MDVPKRHLSQNVLVNRDLRKYKSIYLRICLRINSNSGEKEARKRDYRIDLGNWHGLVFTLGLGLDLPQPAKEASLEASDDECAARQGSMIRLFFSPPRRSVSET